MREASYYESGSDGVVQCYLCPHRCRVAPGATGLCRVRENRDGRLYSLVYGKLAASHVDPIEKKPLFHFLPSSRTYSVATFGCNLSCPFCQNHDISLARHGRKDLPRGYDAEAVQVVDEAVISGCGSVCFTYSEPTIFFEYMKDIAEVAKSRGLGVTMVSNGFIEQLPLKELCSLVDAANIDLKALRPETYRKILGGRMEPVLDTIRTLVDCGVWTEVTTLVVPGMNDNEEELSSIAEFLVSVSKDLPWHVSRFFPGNKYDDRPPTNPDTIRLALETGRRAGLKYLYAGNIPLDRSESTFCPSCGKAVIERTGYFVSAENLTDGNHCAYCGEIIAGVFN